MDEQQIIGVICLIRIIAIGLVAILALLYAIPLCFVRRFHKPLHLLTLNVCIAIFIGTIYYTIDYTLDAYYPYLFWTPKSCLSIIYMKHMVICQELYALCVVSINRLFSVIYRNKVLFRTKKWVGICVIIQWMIAVLLPIPVLFDDYEACLTIGIGIGYRFYLLVIGIVIPAAFIGITNTIIFINARRSTQRVHPIQRYSLQPGAFSHRDVHLLKHIIFIFSVFILTSAPIHILMILRWYTLIVPPLPFQIILTLPVISVCADVTDLFIYNHELRKYLTHRKRLVLPART